MNNNNSMVSVAVFPTATEASIAQGVLANNGIESFIDNSTSSSVYPIAFGSLGFGGVNLVVASQDEERAKQLLDAHND